LLGTLDDRMEVDAGEASLSSEAKRDARFVSNFTLIFPISIARCTNVAYRSLDKTLSAVIACCFKAVTFSNGGGATSDNLRLLMTILGRSLPRGSKSSYVALYEGIETYFANFMDGSGQELDDNALKKSRVPSAEGVEFAKGIAALLLPVSPSESGRVSPSPDKSETEAVRMQRARALLTLASCGVQDVQEKEKATTAVNMWLSGERSGPVREILREAHASLVNQGKNGL
jgi:hypothetical protein